MINKKGQTSGFWKEFFKVIVMVVLFAILTLGLYKLLNYLTT
jgi:LPS O-antigen subunit length determinant protein (WzzB/FepE family)